MGTKMPVHNAEIADIFNKYADLLEIDGANEFRVRAYRTAARTISDQSQNIADMVREGRDLTELSGIGKDLASKIEIIVKTKKLPELDELKKTVPSELIAIMDVAGLGPKRAKQLYRELGISSIEELETAAREGRIKELYGFGEKTEKTILEDIERKGEARGQKKRLKLAAVEAPAEQLVSYLRKGKGVKEAIVAGSYRRRMETVGDLDILVTNTQDSDVMQRFIEYEDVKKVISKGPTRSTVQLRFGLQVDLRAVAEESYGAALHYFTGSKAHNIAVRQMGVKRGLKINEYGVFKGEKRVAGRTEEEVYRQVGLPYIEPELREMRGEIEAAQENRLPKLLELSNIRGDFHSHTKATEGHNSIEEMVEAARKKGYEYLAIADHSKRLSMTHGLDEKRLSEQIEEIDALNEKIKNFRILKSLEIDILEDGSLDLKNDVLKKLDLLICSIHAKFNLSQKKQTDRVIRALNSSPVFTVLGHPTGRLIGEREPYEIDIERVMKEARQLDCALELNAQPERLDINDIYCKMAKDMGVIVVISTDAHSVNELDFMRYGVYEARRGWLEAGDVLNSRNFRALEKLLDSKR
jgi:DNA polymerase (family 10)